MDTSKDYFHGLYIAGEWRKGSGSSIQDVNPWNEEEITTIQGATVSDIDEAYKIAEQAQKEWAALLPTVRSNYMHKIADVITSRKQEYIDLMVQESGSTLIKAIIEVEMVIGVFRSCEALALQVTGETLPSGTPGETSFAIRQPLGVIGLISPWNFPGYLTARTLGPALAVGNAVIVKPASTTIITGGTIFASFFEEAGLPKGIVSILPGKGSEIGTPFVTHPICSLISFTGSTEVGRGIGKQAITASIIKKTELELGGNSPFVVLDDVDLHQAVEAAVWGKFFHQGQICMAINRIIVVDKIYDEFVEKFTKRTKELKYGEMNNPDTFVGPVIDKKQYDKLMGMIRQAEKDGHKMVLGGEPRGLCIPPHIFIDIDENCTLAKNEIFGPIAIIMRAKNTEDAFRIAYNSDRGLSSAIFTNCPAKGMKFAHNIVAGMTHINNQSVIDSLYAPFGGEKNSGIGRFNSKWGINAFTRWHWITVQKTPNKFPFSANDLQ